MSERSPGSEQLKLDFSAPSDIQRLLEENSRLRANIEQLQRQNSDLVTEIERLQQLVYSDKRKNVFSGNDAGVCRNVIDLSETRSPIHSSSVTRKSSISDKIVLFRSYFKGRQDVYAVRGSDRTRKAAYFTKRKYLGKENGKIIWGDNLPLTDEVLKNHLQDEKSPVTVGIYPLLLDETCWFLAIDFDKLSWREDTAAFLETCRSFNVPAALERSRSGNGGHIWIFFDEPVAAHTARMLGSTLLTRTLEKRHQIVWTHTTGCFPIRIRYQKTRSLVTWLPCRCNECLARKETACLLMPITSRIQISGSSSPRFEK